MASVMVRVTRDDHSAWLTEVGPPSISIRDHVKLCSFRCKTF